MKRKKLSELDQTIVLYISSMLDWKNVWITRAIYIFVLTLFFQIFLSNLYSACAVYPGLSKVQQSLAVASSNRKARHVASSMSSLQNCFLILISFRGNKLANLHNIFYHVSSGLSDCLNPKIQISIQYLSPIMPVSGPRN